MASVALFDVDGTLADSMECFVISFEQLAKEKNLFVDVDLHQLMKDKDFKGCVEYFTRFPELGGKHNIIERVFDLCQPFYENTIKPMPNGIEYLNKLKAEGVDMFILTANQPRFINPLLERWGVKDFFAGIFTTQQLGISKYDTSAFEYVLKLTEKRPEEYVMFEDSSWSSKNAKELGMKTIGVFSKGDSKQKALLDEFSDIVIDDYQEIMDIPFSSL